MTYLKRNDILPKKCCKTYARADVGYSWPAAKINSYNYSNKPKGALVATLGAGYVFNSKFRSDITASHRGRYKYSYTDSKKGAVRQEFSSNALMLNGYLSPKIFKYAAPYVMGGIGLAINKAGNFLGPFTAIGDSSESFAWQIGVGSLIKISENANVDIMYKYVNLGNIKTSSLIKSNSCTGNFSACGNFSAFKGQLKVHELSTGISYFF